MVVGLLRVLSGAITIHGLALPRIGKIFSMSDDIVDNLRRWRDDVLWDTEPCPVEAAVNEIVRLRAELNDLYEFIDDMPSGNDALDVWLEARHE